MSGGQVALGWAGTEKILEFWWLAWLLLGQWTSPRVVGHDVVMRRAGEVGARLGSTEGGLVV